MGMNPDTNRFEILRESFTQDEAKALAESMIAKEEDRRSEILRAFKPKDALPSNSGLVRPDGSPVPPNWTVLGIGELVAIKGYTFSVAYLNQGTLVLEPVGPVVVGDKR